MTIEITGRYRFHFPGRMSRLKNEEEISGNPNNCGKKNLQRRQNNTREERENPERNCVLENKREPAQLRLWSAVPNSTTGQVGSALEIVCTLDISMAALWP